MDGYFILKRYKSCVMNESLKIQEILKMEGLKSQGTL